jgi:predicted Zn-dependent peptidase
VIEVLFDLVGRPRFAPAEVEREKSVVREEISASEDNPEDKINELLSARIWPGHALGRPILGTVDTIGALDAQALRGYFESRYRAEQLVVSAAGGLDHERLVSEVERWHSPPSGPQLELDTAPPAFEPAIEHQVRDDLQQLYLSLGTRALAYQDAERYPLVVLSTLLGGGMSSRLFQSVREEAGLAYSIYSAPDFHRDGGMLSIHLGVAPERGREALQRVREELERLRRHGPDEAEVATGRQQLLGSVVMGQESVSTRMSHLAQEELYRGRYVGPDEQIERVTAVTRDQVAALAERFLDPSRYALVAIGPARGAPLTETDWPVAG